MVRPAVSRGSAGNLPVELTSFIGRRTELSEIKRLLSASRLVTLTGFGGVGKTRLALHAAGQLRRGFPDGVWLVELSILSDPVLVPEAVASALGLYDQPAETTPERLIDFLAERDLLLVLDNCEHLLDACAELTERLLCACPGVRVLATSRIPLNCGGEAVLSVAPLPVVGDGTQSDAVSLFIDRVREQRPNFHMNETNRQPIEAICRRLEGIPLALELAAVRLRVMSEEQLLARLDDRFRLLTTGSRAAPHRQRTLRACIEWSYELCTPAQRDLWARASVFVNGFELDAIAAVCPDKAAVTLLDDLQSLIAASILTKQERDGQVRYRMLETVRKYGQQQLRESGHLAAVRRLHRDFYVQLVDQLYADWISDKQISWMARLRLEHPNLQTALEFCVTEPGEADAGLHIAGSLFAYWHARGPFSEARHWLDRLLGASHSATLARAKALRTAVAIASLQGDHASAAALLRELVDLAPVLGEPTLTYAKQASGLAALFTGDLPRAINYLQLALAGFRALSNRIGEAHTLVVLATAFRNAGAGERALACHRECMAITEPTGEAWNRSWSLFTTGLVIWERGNVDEATRTMRESLLLKQAAGDRTGIACCLEALAWMTDPADARRAAILLGAAATLFSRVGGSATALLHEAAQHRECAARARETLGEQGFRQAFAHGTALDLDTVIDYALDKTQPPPPAEQAPSPLTRREQQVAELVAQGLSNKDIARKLVISQRTAETHVEHILTKLGFTSRAQVANWVTQTPAG